MAVQKENPNEPKRIVQSFIDAVNAHDWEGVSHLITPTFQRHSLAAGEPAVRSCADLLAFLQRENRAFPDGHEEILIILSEGDRVAVLSRFSGTQTGPLGSYPASGRCLVASALSLYRVQDDLIIEAWAEWDNLSGLVQLGHLTAPA